MSETIAPNGHGEALDKLDAFGVDRLCEQIADGTPLTKIATAAGVSKGSLLRWLSADPDRSARAAAARRLTAWHWDEMAEQELRDAAMCPEGIAKAREIASHFRWRASKTNPASYGDKLDLNHGGKIAFVPSPVDLNALDATQKAVLLDILALPPPPEKEPE